MTRRICVGMALLLCAGWAFSACGEEIVTNRWLSTEGGSWTDSANWSDPVMIGTNDATAAYFDLSALAAGSRMVFPYVQWGVRTKGVVFGQPGGADSDIWALVEGSDQLEHGDRALFNFKNLADGTPAEVRIENGTLSVNGFLMGSVALKTGPGTLRIDGSWSTELGFRLQAGRLEPRHQECLKKSVVNVISTEGILAISNDIYISRLDLNGLGLGDGFAPVPLNNHAVNYLVPGANWSFILGSVYEGDGTISVQGGGCLNIEVAQTNFTGTYRLDTGDIMLSSAQSRKAAHYMFEDSSDPGVATVGTNLVAVGDAQVVEDAERGRVLRLDGASHLAAPDATTLPRRMCFGKGQFTISFWVKLDPDVNREATLFYMGRWNTTGGCALIRLANADGNGNPGKYLMYTNFGNNKFVGGAEVEALYDGGWHRVTWRFNGEKTHTLWIDGLAVSSYDSRTSQVQDGEFWIGYGKNGKYFKGCIDDFIVSPEAIDDDTISRGILDATSPCLVNPASSVESIQAGALRLSSPQTFATLGGSGSQGQIVLDGDLTVLGSGTESETTEYKAAITGQGGLVKRGADYELVLSGPNAYTGTTTVAEGVLTLKGQNRLETLVGRWTFEDGTDPGKDVSGNNFQLTPSGSGMNVVADPERGGNVVWFGGGCHLEGTTASGVVPEAFPKGNDNYTLSLWIKGSASGNATAGVVVWGSTGSDNLCTLWRLDGSTGWMMTNWGQNHNSTVKNNFRDGVWHHVVWVRRGVEQLVYVDGQFSERWTRTGNLNVQMDGKGFYLAYNPASGSRFTGWMDDVRLYNFALSESEALAEYTGATVAARVSSEIVLPVKPIYKWTFEDETNPWANTGTAPDGTLAARGAARVAEGVDGRPGKVLDLRGETMGYLEAETFPESMPVGKSAWTVACWIRPSVKNGSECALYWGDPAKDFGLLGLWDNLGCHRITLRSGFDVSSVASTVNGGSALAKWHHLAATYDGSNVRLYLDGALVASRGGISNLNVGNAYFWIGRKQSSSTDWYQGCIDDVEVYDTSLSETTIRSIIRSEQNNASDSVLPPNSPVVVEAGARLRLLAVDATAPTLAGAGTVAITGGTLTLTESCTFDGTLELDSMNSLSLAEGVTLKLTGRNSTVGGTRLKGGRYGLGAGTAVVGEMGSMVLIR